MRSRAGRRRPEPRGGRTAAWWPWWRCRTSGWMRWRRCTSRAKWRRPRSNSWLARLRDHQESELRVAAMALSCQEREGIQHLVFLSDKPLVLVANIAEEELGGADGPLLAPLREHAGRTRTPLLDVCAKVEAEVA